MDEKKATQSLTIWVNAVSLIAMLVQSQTGFVVGPEAQAALLTIINIFLRFKTTKPIKKTNIGGPTTKSFATILMALTMIIGMAGTVAAIETNSDIRHNADYVYIETEEKVSRDKYIPNLNMDVLFATNGYTLQSISTELAESKDGLFHLKAGYATALQDSDAPDYTVIGATVYIKSLVEKLGWTWKAITYNPSLGVAGLFDLSGDERPAIAISLNALRFEHDLFK